MSTIQETISLEEAREKRDADIAAAVKDLETPQPTPVLEAPVQPVAAAPEDNEPDPFTKTADGWEAKLDVGEGGVQVYKGATRKEVEKALLKAQANASKKIREQNRQIKLGTGLLTPDLPEQIPAFEGRELTADEQFEISTGLNEPAKVRSAFRKIIEAEFGAPPEVIRRELKDSAETRRVNKEFLVGQTWAARNPQFYGASAKNREAMQAYIDKHFQGAVTEKNLTIAFNDLSDSGLLEEKPKAVQVPVQPVTPVVPATPTTASAQPAKTEVRTQPASTGISPRDASRSEATPKPIAPNLALAAEQIKRMKSTEYKQRMGDPQFRALVDKLSELNLL